MLLFLFKFAIYYFWNYIKYLIGFDNLFLLLRFLYLNKSDFWLFYLFKVLFGIITLKSFFLQIDIKIIQIDNNIYAINNIISFYLFLITILYLIFIIYIMFFIFKRYFFQFIGKKLK